MAAEPGARGWWHTLPGLLTAMAGTITALAGMLVALHQVGVLNLTGRSEPGPGVSDTEVVRSGITGSVSPQPGVPSPGGTPGIANAPAPTSANSLPHSLGGGGQLRSEGLVYELLDVRLERHSAGNLRLTIPMRVTNTEKPAGWLFGRDQFRLQVDGILRAPTEGTVAEVVSYYSSLDGHVEFTFPENAREVTLVLIGDGGPIDRHALEIGGPR